MKKLVKTIAMALFFAFTITACGDDVLQQIDIQEIKKDTGNEDDPDSDPPTAG